MFEPSVTPSKAALATNPTSARTALLAVLTPLALTLSGCLATGPTIGGGSATPVTGAAAGGTAVGANSQLERCDKPLGVLRIQEDTRADWYRHYYGRLGSTAPVLNALIMQSNCFVVVERGNGEADIRDETNRARGDEARESATRGKGQQVSADYLLKPEIVMNNRNADSGRASVGGLLPGVLAGVTAGFKTNEAGTVLTLVDIRSTVRLAAAEGYSKNTNFSVGGGAFGGLSGAMGSSPYGRTDEGKVITAAFFDSYNKLVVALRQYKAQTVKGGLGQGGTLGVSGGSTEASKEVDRKGTKK
jgi:hypothetical protein